MCAVFTAYSGDLTAAALEQLTDLIGAKEEKQSPDLAETDDFEPFDVQSDKDDDEEDSDGSGSGSGSDSDAEGAN